MPALTERTSKTTFASRQCSTSPDTPYSTDSEHNVNCQLGIVIRWLQHFDVCVRGGLQLSFLHTALL